MARQGGTTSTPRLRFPAFRDQKRWTTRQLGEACELYQSETVPSSSFTAGGAYLVYGAGGIIGRLDRFNHECSEVIIGCRGICGNASLTQPESWITGNAMVIRPRTSELTKTFLFHSIEAADLSPVVSGSAQPQITRQGLKRFPISIPAPAEQQTIADCLTSLDEVIAAHGRKVEALKAHKRGLMQQLFPREGETRPRLRFPEFRSAANWCMVNLGELLESKPEYGINAPAVPFSPTLPAYLRITDIDDDGRYIPERKVSVEIDAKPEHYLTTGDIVLARTGASVGKSYHYREEDGRLVFAGFLIRIRPNKRKAVPSFVFNFLRSQQYWDWVHVASARSGQPGINSNEYAALPIPIPPLGDEGRELAEQQRIADCLASIDTRISAEADRLAALKSHKQGLMQQLFPVPEVAGT